MTLVTKVTTKSSIKGGGLARAIPKGLSWERRASGFVPVPVAPPNPTPTAKRKSSERKDLRDPLPPSIRQAAMRPGPLKGPVRT